MLHNLNKSHLIRRAFVISYSSLKHTTVNFNKRIGNMAMPSADGHVKENISRIITNKRKKNEITQKEERKKDRYKKKYSHTSCYVQVMGLGTDTNDVVPSLMLFFDNFKYIFNVGAGFQRYCSQNRIRFNNISSVLFTRMSSDAAAGLPGFLLTGSGPGWLGVNEEKVLSIHGPMKLEILMDSINTFISTRSMNLSISSFGSELTEGDLLKPIVQNDQVTISPIVILPSISVKTELPPKSSYPENELGSNLTGIPNYLSVPNKTGGSRDKHYTLVPAACYVCQMNETKGKFLVEKAKLMKVRMGPDCSRLVDGEAVNNMDGEIVYPSDVMEPTIPGPICIIIDCPDETYFRSLFSASGLRQWFKETDDSKNRNFLIVHLAAYEIVSSSEYKEWLGKFPKNSEHIFVNQRCSVSTAVVRDSAILQAKLNMIDNRIFPLPKTFTNSEFLSPPCGTRGEDLLKYYFKSLSSKGYDMSDIKAPLTTASIVETTSEENPEFLESIREYQKLKEEMLIDNKYPLFEGDEERTRIMESIDQNDLAITFLGTGAAIPSKYRNVTSIYFDFFARGSLLADCGEGTYGQLIRKFGIEGARDAIKKLRCIWLSHIHADHHVGVPEILLARQKLLSQNDKPILIIGPASLFYTLQAYSKLEPLFYKYLMADKMLSQDSWANEGTKLVHPGSLVLYCDVKEKLNLLSLYSFKVHHCQNAFGLVVEGMKGWKVVFSGDTRPHDNTVKHSKDATLLIHEATFEDDMINEALEKKHSTTTEAIEIAKRSNAYRTILTHFSQRYPKIPVIDNNFNESISVAFDLMTINLVQLSYLPLTLEPCKKLFSKEDYGIDEDQDPDPASMVQYIT